MDLKNLKTILLDGDGVLWMGDLKHPQLIDFFEILDKYNINWALLTNNNTRTVEAYVDKLNNFGIPTTKDKVFTSSTVTLTYIREKYGDKAHIHVVGMHDLILTLSRAGFIISTGEQMPTSIPVAVVAGMDRELNHDKIKVAMRLIMAGAEFIATNTDGSYPTPDGINPGTGMVIGALQATSASIPTVIGKPNSAIFKTAMAKLNASIESTVMVGDRLETDILGANRLGIHTMLVLTGVTTKEMLRNSEIQPDQVFESIYEIGERIKSSNS